MSIRVRQGRWRRSRARLTIVGVEVVDIGVTERSSRDGVSTNSNARDGTDHAEDLVEHRFCDGRVEFSNVEGSRGRGTSVGGGGLDSRGGSVSSGGGGSGFGGSFGNGSGSGDLGSLDGSSGDFRRGGDDGRFGGRHFWSRDYGVGGGN